MKEQMGVSMLSRKVIVLSLGLLIATPLYAGGPQVAWETQLQGPGHIVYFTPDQNGGVVIITVDEATSMFRLSWLDRAGKFVVQKIGLGLILISVSSKGIVVFDGITEVLTAIDATGNESTLPSSAGTAPVTIYNQYNVPQTYDATGFFVQVGDPAALRIRRYRW